MQLRIGLVAALVLGCGGSPRSDAPVVGQPPSVFVESTTALTSGGWQVDMDPVLGTAVRIRTDGTAFPAVASEPELERAAVAFVRQHLDLFGTGELVSDGAVFDRDLSSIVLLQQHRGVPVVGGHLALAISHGKLVLVQGTTYPVGDLATAPRVALATAIASTHAAVVQAARAGDRESGRLVVLPRRTANTVAYHLAWEVTAWRDADQTVAYVDAGDGELLEAHDANRYDQHVMRTHRGTATHDVDARTVGDTIVKLPASYLRLHTARGSAMTDATGAFAFTGQVGSLVVTAELGGRFVEVRNVSGPSAKLTGMLWPGREHALDWTEARSTPEERDVFRGVNATNRFVATVFPDLPWMEHPLVAKVNHPRTCNAYWNGTSINFFAAGNGCNNSGRIFDVIAHEWGHGLDQNAPGGAMDGALGEFIGDLVSFVQTRSPLIGPGFLVDGRAVRDLEDPDFQCYDPGKREVHAAGQLLGAVVWDILQDLERAGFTGEPQKRLLLLPIAIAQSRAGWYSAMLAVDDDDGNLANGTPHECLIYDQFKAHSCGRARWPGIPAQDPPHCAR